MVFPFVIGSTPPMSKKKKKRYAVRFPLNVKGGIRAQAARAAPSRVWWGRRWIAVLEAFRMGPRFGRGRHYAASGQTSELSLAPGRVTAAVQGAAATPYQCEIRFARVSGDAKARVVAALRQRPMLVARLLVGDLPPDIEPLFEAEGCPLFPTRENDLHSTCDCPDWANPCKHLAAVYYLLGETLSKHPLTLLEIRGVSRADLAAARAEEGRREAAGTGEAAAPLTREAFYGRPRPLPEGFGAAPKTDIAAPLVRRLGPLPFWRGQERFCDTLEILASRAASRGWAVWTGDPLDLRPAEERVVVKGASLRLKQTLRVSG